MNRNQLGIFKFLIFLFGFAVIAFAYHLLGPAARGEELTNIDKFMWINICVCYAMFFMPMFFSSITTKTVDTKITSTVHIWISTSFFVFATLILIVCVKTETLELKYALIIECILFFILAIFVYFGYFAGNHIGEVQAAERKSLAKIGEVKNAFEMLNLKAGTFGDEFREQKAKIAQFCDDVRYMSPVDTEQAADIEMKLIIAANVISSSTLSAPDLNAKIAEMDLLIKQRKLLRK